MVFIFVSILGHRFVLNLDIFLFCLYCAFLTQPMWPGWLVLLRWRPFLVIYSGDSNVWLLADLESCSEFGTRELCFASLLFKENKGYTLFNHGTLCWDLIIGWLHLVLIMRRPLCYANNLLHFQVRQNLYGKLCAKALLFSLGCRGHPFQKESTYLKDCCYRYPYSDPRRLSHNAYNHSFLFKIFKQASCNVYLFTPT